jgi:hypothetical protein
VKNYLEKIWKEADVSYFEEDPIILYLPGRTTATQKNPPTGNSVKGRRMGASGSGLVSDGEHYARESDLQYHLCRRQSQLKTQTNHEVSSF